MESLKMGNKESGRRNEEMGEAQGNASTFFPSLPVSGGVADVQNHQNLTQPKENSSSFVYVSVSNFFKNPILVAATVGDTDTVYIPGFRKSNISNSDRGGSSVRSSIRRNSLSLVDKIR
ncbi:hypothetical protein [Nostoc sp. TCL26-01]|uniref:hypothetical protein n=1 Tax=Nostoc sp. TCL26-01 TaxID=2576904 RepID=UPI0015BCA661|nr:hypothetical protein [Nostoc sp. TCL26-01]